MTSFILQHRSVHSLPHTQAQRLEADPEAGGTYDTCSPTVATDRCHHCLNSWLGMGCGRALENQSRVGGAEGHQVDSGENHEARTVCAACSLRDSAPPCRLLGVHSGEM